MESQVVIEHGESTLGRRLRLNRLKLALAIAAIEGIVVLAGVIPWWFVLLLAVAAVATYVGFGREHRSAEVRTVTWTAAVSQLIVVLVPALAAVAIVLAAVAIVLVAAVVLAALLLDRR